MFASIQLLDSRFKAQGLAIRWESPARPRRRHRVRGRRRSLRRRWGGRAAGVGEGLDDNHEKVPGGPSRRAPLNLLKEVEPGWGAAMRQTEGGNRASERASEREGEREGRRERGKEGVGELVCRMRCARVRVRARKSVRPCARTRMWWFGWWCRVRMY